MTNCLVITYNCAKTAKTTAGIKELYSSLLNNSTDAKYIAVCLQEVAPILNGVTNQVQTFLDPFIELFPSSYQLIAQNNIGATAILLFSNAALAPGTTVKKDSIPFGIFWSNLKGGALLRIEGEQENITFISCHLAANEGYVQDRNENFKLMENQFGFSRTPGPIIVAGDLNYRTTNGKLATDELSIEMQRQNVAVGFKESEIEFEPTYKYVTGTNSLISTRIPSWCDRVLYKPISGFETTAYNSYTDLRESDHLPVYLSFDAEFDTMLNARSIDSNLVNQAFNVPYMVGFAANYSIAGYEFLMHTGWGNTAGVLAILLFLYSVIF